MSPSPAIRIAVLLATLLLAALVSPDAAAASRAATSIAPGTGYVLPLPPPPTVLTPFAPPPTRYGAGHRGVDLAADVGAVISAAGAGLVVFAGELAGRGVVSVEHEGGLRTTYEPVTASVTAGSAIAVGQPVGTLQAGHADCVPASCLHWGARLPDGSYLDPLALLRPWSVRLWPWDGR